MKFSLGPILYYWPKQQVLDFYQQAQDSAADVIYLGEAVCGKRHLLRAADWIELAQQLANSGDKQIILSTLALIESSADMAMVKKLCAQNNILVEANDMAAVQVLSEQKLPFVAGPSINIYNHHSLDKLASLGMCRWVMPVELGRSTLTDILSRSQAIIDGKVETEVFAYGHLPLAYSARCFTARALELSKDNCQFSCVQYPEGMSVTSQQEQTLFRINGIQTLSGHCYNLIDQLDAMKDMGVNLVRISPESEETFNILNGFKDHTNNCKDSDVICSNGYWFGEPGMENIHSLT